jgi:thioredoxin-related protein
MKHLMSITFIISLFSCNTTIGYDQFLNEKLKANYSSYVENYSTVIIIPREGCHACIREAEIFFEENKDNREYLFIFTRVSSKKELIITIGNEYMEKENVLIDKNNSFYLFEQEDSYYPLRLIKESNGKFSYSKLVL